MRKFIALAIFSIGMLVMWPPGEQVKAATSDQVCFVVDSHQAVQAYDVQVINAENFVAYELQAIKQPVCTAENVIQESPDFNKFYRLNYRTCLYDNGVRSLYKSQGKSCVHQSIIRIRDDTSLV